MNLQPITPTEPVFAFICRSCERYFNSTAPGARVDLGSEPFADYYCAACARAMSPKPQGWQVGTYGATGFELQLPPLKPWRLARSVPLKRLTLAEVRLIAAAPELADALERAIAHMQQLARTPAWVEDGRVALRKAGRLGTGLALAALLSLPGFAAEPCSINLNSATATQLQLFGRTGPVLAGKLASGRPYKALEDVDAVKGIGPAWLVVNGPHVALTGPTTCTEKIKAARKIVVQGPKL